MLNHIYDNDSIHTQSANEVELRVRTREEQRYMLGVELNGEEAEQGKRTSNPDKVSLAGLFTNTKVIFQAVVGLISHYEME
jgi:hypothetical protein